MENFEKFLESHYIKDITELTEALHKNIVESKELPENH